MRRTGLTRRALPCLAMAVLCALMPGPAAAQSVTSAATGQFSGPDRQQRLVAGAKKEGTLTLYSSTALEDMTPLVSGFEKKYGIKVRLWRGASTDILQRAVTEARAGHHEVDVIETASPEMEALSREGVFQNVKSPAFSELMPEAVVQGRPWVASRLIIFTVGYNSNLIRRADLPVRFEDLLQPKWRGKIGIEATDTYWFMTVVSALGEERGIKLFRDLAQTNRLSARKGHTLLSNLVVSGEVPLALNIYRHEVGGAKAAGAPIDMHPLAPNVVYPAAIAVTKRAPHPHAAMLFQDFLLTDGQKIWADLQRTPTNLKYQRLPPGLKLTFVDTTRFLNESAKWEALYRSVLTTRPR